ncbi:hypothetical protein M3196_11880 [Fictibacillus nanhaiensis]|nr:hypothetical protein [Fictibacillus nanhaiensis]MCM3732361.1 hypothetical protein [Fictibacillus nanhaiensis]
MDTDKLAMAIYLLALAQIEASGETFVSREVRTTQRKLHEVLGLKNKN